MYFNISIKLISFEVVFIELLNSITINYVFMGVMNPRKESIMAKTNNNVTNNNAIIKEETAMKRAIIIVTEDGNIETTLDAMSFGLKFQRPIDIPTNVPSTPIVDAIFPNVDSLEYCFSLRKKYTI